MSDKKYMLAACEEAQEGMRNNDGGPFGAVIVMDGKIIGRGHNMVTSTNDPTAHAEVMAIRDACKNVQNFHLSAATLYTSCEPCPMCMAAIYWANIKKVYFASNRNDAERIGFNDKFIYDELQLPIENRSIEMKHLHAPLADEVFDEWTSKFDKTEY
ncbi:Guanine deaminase [uncultured Paludibacter sp.]|uniref:Guanine deaminase n=1 Tax=uncultured Paludibacter sp. TaxID=497635 RepID=A0A653ADA6_9BACT|nr:Guanine deaminase [uncultured Paludibacter sp.]